MNRRDFLRDSLAAALAGAASASAAQAQEGGKSRVAVVLNHALETEQSEEACARMVVEMVHESVRLLGGGNVTREQAWQTYLQPKDVVGVKLSCIAPPMTPHPAILTAVAQGAGFCGIPDNHVIGFDKEDRDLERAGFTLNKGILGVRCYGTVGPPDAGNPGYETDPSYGATISYHLSRIVTRQVKAIVNVPVIKDHTFAGITCSLKNHFGCIDNPNQFHYENNCCPAVVEVNRDQAIRGKQRLIICDARALQYDGGPSFKPQFLQPYCGIFAATDPVAMDTVAIELLNMCRTRHGLEPLERRSNPPLHVAEAAKQRLGCNDLAQIEVVSKDLTPKKAP